MVVAAVALMVLVVKYEVRRVQMRATGYWAAFASPMRRAAAAMSLAAGALGAMIGT